MSLSKETIDKLRRVLQRVKEEPTRLDMADWGYSTDSKSKAAQTWLRGEIVWAHDEDPPPPCGTVGCFAGNAIFELVPRKQLVADYGENRLDWEKNEFYQVIRLPFNSDDVAADLLGLDTEQADLLFYPDEWPRKYRKAYDWAANKPTPEERAQTRYQALADLVEAFIAADGDIETVKTGGRDVS